MKKLLFSLLALCACMSVQAAGQITSNPSPAVTTKSLEVTITGVNFDSDVYCYTWCADINGAEKTPTWSWTDVHTDKFRMTRVSGGYKLTIQNIKEFYELNDSEIEGLTKLGFIAKTASGQQTDDLFVQVVQGRRDVYSGGEGTQASPFILKTTADLKAFSETPGDWGAGVYAELGANIDASQLTGSIGTMRTPYSGNFDGNSYTVSGVNLSNTEIGSATGLFGVIDGGSVSNLGIQNGRVSGATYTGMLVGYLESGSLKNCCVSGTVTGSSICVGGLVGENLSGTISDCYSSVKVTNEDDYATGGLAGKNRGVISNTYATGSIQGHDYVGGLVGANYGTVKNSVAINEDITSYQDYAARFGGNNNSRNLGDNNYSWDGIESGRDMWTEHGHHASLKSARDLNDHEKFEYLTDWDFDNVWEWRTENNRDYPALRAVTAQKNPLSESFYRAITGISEIIEGDARICAGPNPTEGELKVTSAEGVGTYTLCSLNGSVIAQGKAHGAPEVIIDMTSQPAGLYILRAGNTNGAEAIFKIIRK